MDDYSKIEKGHKLVITLCTGEIYEGIFQHGSKNVIYIDDIKELSTKRVLPTSLSFHMNEIIEICDLNDKILNDFPTTQKSNKTEAVKPIQQEQLQTSDYSNYIYFTKYNSDCDESLCCISNSEIIGVVGVGANLISLIVSVKSHIYEYDSTLFRNDRFKTKIKTILELDAIKKVLYHTSYLIHCLNTFYSIHINNVFNIMIADAVIIQNKTGIYPDTVRTLGDILKTYFSVSDCIAQMTSENVKLTKWNDIAVNESSKLHAAILVSYHIPLKEKLEKLMLDKFYTAVDYHSNFLKNMSNYLALQNSETNKVPDKIKELLNASINIK